MGFQNTINNTIGAVGAAAGLGKHIMNQNKELLAKEAEAKEGLMNTADQIHILGNEYLLSGEAEMVKNADGTIKADEALDMMGKKVAEGLNNGSIEMEKGIEALTRMKQLRAARAKFKFELGDKKAFEYQNTPMNKET